MSEIFFYDKPFKHCTRAMPSMKKRRKKPLMSELISLKLILNFGRFQKQTQ